MVFDKKKTAHDQLMKLLVKLCPIRP